MIGAGITRWGSMVYGVKEVKSDEVPSWSLFLAHWCGRNMIWIDYWSRALGVCPCIPTNAFPLTEYMYWIKNEKYRQEVVGKEKVPNRMRRGKNYETNVEGEKRHNWFCCEWKFALTNKASTGTVVEVSSSPVHLCTVTSLCHKSRCPPAPRTGPCTPNEIICGFHLLDQEAEGLRIGCRFQEEGRREASSCAE